MWGTAEGGSGTNAPTLLHPGEFKGQYRTIPSLLKERK